jgi:hypothetical protein
MAIWVFKNGIREGPYEEGDVRELIYEGTYHDSDPAVRDGDAATRTLGEILGRPGEAASPPPLMPAMAAEPPPLVEGAAAMPPPLPREPDPAAVSVLPEPPTPPAQPEMLPVAGALAEPIPVRVVDFRMSFGSMVVFMVKWVVASIPAFLILATLGVIFWMAIVALAAGFLSSLAHH